MKYQLQNITTTDLRELERKIESGARFVVFNYRIGLGFISILKLSPAILITNENELRRYSKKYNFYNLIMGPWTFFKGPLYAYNAFKLNKNGGIDVTRDIMVNISQESLMAKEVELVIIHEIFMKVGSSDKKNIREAINKTDLNIVPLKKAYTGLFINGDEHQNPHFVIGIELYKEAALNVEHIRNNLYLIFYKHVEFEIIDSRENPEYFDKLKEQGELIYP